MLSAKKDLVLNNSTSNPGSRASQLVCVDDADIVRGILSSDIAPSMPLMEAGLDSLGAVELRTAVSAAFSIPLPATAAFDHPTISALADYILSKAPAQQQQVQHYRSVLGLNIKCIIMFPTERLLYAGRWVSQFTFLMKPTFDVFVQLLMLWHSSCRLWKRCQQQGR